MRRFLTLLCLLLLAIPAGVSFSGCTRNPGADYCNGQGFGLKINDVAAITLAPATTGISIAYGQTHQANPPQLVTCKGTSTSGGTLTWGTTNRQLVDISPTGNICAGSWNRDTGGGIANYTICSPPASLPSTGGLPYATAFITASASTVVSNPVEVFVHGQVTSINLVGPQTCLSQGTQATLDAEACYSQNSTQYEFCAPASVSAASKYSCPGGLAPGVTSVPNCTSAIGTLNYAVGTSSIGTVTTDTTTNQVTITANQPGTSTVTASVAQSGSSAGYFTTCPPKSISITLANGQTQGTITRGVTQNLVTTILDTNGKQITGLSLDYQSTDPIDISAGGGGSITTSFPGVASVYAICQPFTCNPAPINQIGLFGTGLPLSSNPVTITVPGTASDFVWFGAPGQSKYIVPVELLTGTVGSTVLLPYVPNSMVMDRLGTTMYFGSERELMSVSTTSGAIGKQDTAAPGVVLAVAPDNSQLLINDQIRQVFYLYGISATGSKTFGGMGTAAAWTPDSKTLYVTDSASAGPGHSDTLYVYNASTGWISCSAGSACAGDFAGAKNLALTIPSVGAYLSGNPTVTRTWCPAGTAANYNGMIFYPQGDVVVDQSNNPVNTDLLATTTDGEHILGAAVNGNEITLSDIANNIPTVELSSGIQTPISCPETTDPVTGIETLSSLSVGPKLGQTLTLDPSLANATAVNQIVPSPQSNLAFITYAGSANGAQLPYYVPGSGTVNYLPLTGGQAITAPLAGAFTPDDKLFFVSTAGDNMIHYISVPLVTSDPAHADTQQISPSLPACTPGTDAGCTLTAPTNSAVPATVIVVKPRPTT